MNTFVHDDGQGNLYNDQGMAVTIVEMKLDEEMYPIETVTDFAMYLDLIKPPEKLEKKNYTTISHQRWQAGGRYKSSRHSQALQRFRKGAVVYLDL